MSTLGRKVPVPNIRRQNRVASRAGGVEGR